MKRWLLLVFFALLAANLLFAQNYEAQGTVNLALSGAKLTAVDPLVYTVAGHTTTPVFVHGRQDRDHNHTLQ